MAGQSYDLVVCAGVSSVKWLANKNPAGDRAGIARLISVLESVSAGEFILISTIDVYTDVASGEDEQASLDTGDNHPYGAHRLELEQWCSARFANCRIARLPALFGAGLRKNALFDLLHDNETHKINPRARFQWYPLNRLADDLDVMRGNDLRLVNLFSEGLSMGEVRDAFFPQARLGEAVDPAPTYDLRSCHAKAFGGQGRHVMDATSILGEMARFVTGERRRAVGTSA
jgi:nucleoside-diphosphate-sugar epimerase